MEELVVRCWLWRLEALLLWQGRWAGGAPWLLVVQCELRTSPGERWLILQYGGQRWFSLLPKPVDYYIGGLWKANIKVTYCSKGFFFLLFIFLIKLMRAAFSDESNTTELTGSRWDVAVRKGQQLETCSVLGVKAVLTTQWSIYWINLRPTVKPELS